jgi:hypothetical protein
VFHKNRTVPPLLDYRDALARGSCVSSAEEDQQLSAEEPEAVNKAPDDFHPMRIRPYIAADGLEQPPTHYPGRFLRHRNFQLWVDPYQDTRLFHADSSFRITGPLA